MKLWFTIISNTTKCILILPPVSKQVLSSTAEAEEAATRGLLPSMFTSAR